MSMRGKIVNTSLFLLAIAGLQFGLATLSARVPQIGKQAELIESEHIDPSALFYTESKLALAAQRKVRASLPQPSVP